SAGAGQRGGGRAAGPASSADSKTLARRDERQQGDRERSKPMNGETLHTGASRLMSAWSRADFGRRMGLIQSMPAKPRAHRSAAHPEKSSGTTPVPAGRERPPYEHALHVGKQLRAALRV